MLNINFLAKVIGPDSLYCGKWGKLLKAYSDLDLHPTVLNIELVRAIFIYYNVFQFHAPRSIMLVIMQTHDNYTY